MPTLKKDGYRMSDTGCRHLKKAGTGYRIPGYRIPGTRMLKTRIPDTGYPDTENPDTGYRMLGAQTAAAP